MRWVDGPPSDRAALARHDPDGELVDVLELLVDQGRRVLLDRLQVRSLLRDDLRRRRLRLVDPLPDLRDDPPPRPAHLAGLLLNATVFDAEVHLVVKLS